MKYVINKSDSNGIKSVRKTGLFQIKAFQAKSEAEKQQCFSFLPAVREANL